METNLTTSNPTWIMVLTEMVLPFIVHIFADGLLLYFLQQLISKRVERKSRFENIREEIFRQYISHIETNLLLIREFTDLVVNKRKLDQLNALIDNIKASLRKLRDYYKDYSIVLQTDTSVKSSYEAFDARFKKWCANSDVPSTIAFLSELEPLLQSLLAQCVKHIYGIK